MTTFDGEFDDFVDTTVPILLHFGIGANLLMPLQYVYVASALTDSE